MEGGVGSVHEGDAEYSHEVPVDGKYYLGTLKSAIGDGMQAVFEQMSNDGVIDFLSVGWSLVPDALAFSSGHWKLKEAASASSNYKFRVK